MWCIFYLRNNAFKSFYRIRPWYLAKEFLLVFLILLTSISYTLSFQYGVRLHIRGITGEQEMLAEMNTVNQGMVYVPTSRENYFVLNDCEGRRLREIEEEKYREGTTQVTMDSAVIAAPKPDREGDTVISSIYLDSARAREVLSRPDAYSFLNYCTAFLSSYHYDVDSTETISATNQRWLRGGQQDSVKQSIDRLFAVLVKYKINHRLKADSLTNAVFRDQYFTVSNRLPESQYDYIASSPGSLEYFFDFRAHQLSNVFNLIEDAQPAASDYTETWNVIGYTALGFSVLLLCYRRFSKRVFLISIVGSLLWAILVGLVGVGSRGFDLGIPILLLILFLAFGIIGWFLVRSRGNKTAAGVLLCWHAYLAPFAVMLVVWLISEYLSGQRSHYYNYPDEFFAKNFPFSTWVKNNVEYIFLANIPAVVLYLALAFNGWAKRWQAMPEE